MNSPGGTRAYYNAPRGDGKGKAMTAGDVAIERRPAAPSGFSRRDEVIA